MSIRNVSSDYSIPMRGQTRRSTPVNPHTKGYDDDGKIITIDIGKFGLDVETYTDFLEDDSRLHMTLTALGLPVADVVNDTYGCFPEPLSGHSLSRVFGVHSDAREVVHQLMGAFERFSGSPFSLVDKATGKRLAIVYPLVEVNEWK